MSYRALHYLTVSTAKAGPVIVPFLDCVTMAEARNELERLGYRVAVTCDHKLYRGAPEAVRDVQAVLGPAFEIRGVG